MRLGSCLGRYRICAKLNQAVPSRYVHGLTPDKIFRLKVRTLIKFS